MTNLKKKALNIMMSLTTIILLSFTMSLLIIISLYINSDKVEIFLNSFGQIEQPPHIEGMISGILEGMKYHDLLTPYIPSLNIEDPKRIIDDIQIQEVLRQLDGPEGKVEDLFRDIKPRSFK